LGRSFLRRLYNLLINFPLTPHARRRLSSEAREDMKWWLSLLPTSPATRFLRRDRTTIFAWSDASGTKGMGVYYRLPNQDLHHITESQVFSAQSPRHIQQKREHINTKEMRAVEQCLLR
jgi:hypothetical protein